MWDLVLNRFLFRQLSLNICKVLFVQGEIADFLIIRWDKMTV